MWFKGKESFNAEKGGPHRLPGEDKRTNGGRINRTGMKPLFSVRAWRAFLLATLVACAAAALLFLSPALQRGSRTVVEAASPASGTISPLGPVLPFTGTWTGTATGT